MKLIALLGGCAALAAAAASWAAPGPVVTRGSAALPRGCAPDAAAAAVSTRAAVDGHRLVYAEVLPNRKLEPNAEVAVGVSGDDGAFTVRATLDCATHEVLAWAPATQTTAFTMPGACPVPKGWRVDGPPVACSALPTAWETASDFHTAAARATAACTTAVGRTAAIALLHALDYAKPAAFAAAFRRDARFQPYTASVTRALVGRTAIAAFVRTRVARADGWTATALSGPFARTRTSAAYTVALVAFANGDPVGAGAARMTLDCTSGLIRDWRGPALPLPS